MTNMYTPQFNEKKFYELMLYIAYRGGGDGQFGATKLNKILHRADFQAYGRSGSSITGATYWHLDRGPCPLELFTVQDAMIACQDARLDEEVIPAIGENDKQRTRKRLVPLREPDLSLFSDEELDTVDEAIRFFYGKNAKQASDYTHKLPGWKATNLNDVIPYESVFVSERKLTAKEKKLGRVLAKKYGWPTQL